jgi:hypothetical protein
MATITRSQNLLDPSADKDVGRLLAALTKSLSRLSNHRVLTAPAVRHAKTRYADADGGGAGAPSSGFRARSRQAEVSHDQCRTAEINPVKQLADGVTA